MKLTQFVSLLSSLFGRSKKVTEYVEDDCGHIAHISYYAPSEVKPPEQPKEELTPLQQLLKRYIPSQDLLVLCRKDYEQYLTELEEGKVPAVDVNQVITFQGLSNSAIVKCGHSGWWNS